MADAAKRRRGRKRDKPIDLKENADRPQWAGKQEAKEKEERLRLAKQIPFWREGERPKVGDYLLAYYGFEKRGNSGFFIARIAKINTEKFDTQYFVYFFLSKATVERTFHLLQPIYTWMKSEGKGRNCLSLEDNGNFYDLEKSCVVRFLNKASATKPRSYTKRYKGKEPKKRKREVQEQKAPPLLAPPKRTAMAAAGPSSATQKREKPGPKGKWMREFFKQETEDDSKQEMEDDSDEPEPNEKELKEQSVREFQKLLLF